MLILLMPVIPVYSQLYPVTTMVQATGPALPPYLHQWTQPLGLSSPVQVTLQFNDLKSDPISAAVRLRLDGPGVTIGSNPNLPTIVTLQPGQILTLEGDALTSLFSPDRLGPNVQGIGQVPLPEGIYTLCIEVYELLRNSKISNTACTVIKVQRFDVPEWKPIEPVLHLPEERDDLGVVAGDQASLFTLNWSPRHPQLFMAEYTLAIFAQPKSMAQLTWEQVVNSTFPFFETTTFSTSYLYQLSDPPLDSNHIYLARITVRDPQGIYQFVNNGIGPVGAFRVSSVSGDSGGTLCSDEANRPILVLELTGESGVELSWQLPEGISEADMLVQSRYGSDSTGWIDYGHYDGAEGGVSIYGSEVPADRYRVGFLCPEGTMMWSNVVSVIPFPEVLPDSCGIPVDLELENMDPLDFDLVNGDSLLVGDFVLVLEDVYYNGVGYNGIGYIATPFFNILKPKVAVELRNVQVNTDFRMMGGLISTVYDEEQNLLANIGDLQALFAELGGLDDLAYSVEEISDSIVGVRINTNGETEIITLDSLGHLEVRTLPLQLNPPQGIGTILVREGYVSVGDVFLDSQVSGPTTFIGTDGKIYGQVDGAIYTESDLLTGTLEDSLGKLGVVNFEKHPEEPGGLDTYFEESEEGDYGQIEDYRMPWKALLLGTSERVWVDVSESTADSFYMVTHSGYELSYQQEGEKLEVAVPGINDGDLDALYVLGRVTTDSHLHTLGGMRIASYPLKLLTVHVIPVNGAQVPIDEAELATALNRIYNPAIATWQVKILDNREITFDEDGDGVLATGKGTTGQFNKEMRNVASALGGLLQKGTRESPVLTIVVVPELDAEYDGYMPRGRNLGFVRSNAPDFARVVAHELGHGAFGLQHSWEEYPGLTQGRSDHLMDYGNGTRLTKRQWDQIHIPLAVLGLFETSEGGGSVSVDTKGKPISEYFGDLVTDDHFIPFLTPGHTRIILSKNITDPVFFHGIESDQSRNLFTGCLMRFKEGEKEFTAKINDGLFYGYYSGSERFSSIIPDLASTRSREIISLVYPCGDQLYAQSFSASSIQNYAESAMPLISESETSLRLYKANALYNSISFEKIGGLFTGDQTGISEEEVEMTQAHCHTETAIIVSKISQYRNRYPQIFAAFSGYFDEFFVGLLIEESSAGPYNLKELGEFERMLRDDASFHGEMSELWEKDKYAFYIRFLAELEKRIEAYTERKSACLSNIEAIDVWELYECIKYFSQDELEEIDAISKFLIIKRFIDAYSTPDSYEKEIIRLISNVKDAEQADALFVLFRNDLASSDPVASIKRLFYSVDDAIIFGADDRRDLLRSLTKLCSSSATFTSQAQEQAEAGDFQKYTYLFYYQSIWRDLLETTNYFFLTHIESSGVFADHGQLILQNTLEKGFTKLMDLTRQELHALDPIFFINKSKLGQLSDYDNSGRIVPAVVAKYAISSGDQETIRDAIDAAVDIASLAIGAGAIKLGISGLRRGIILADAVSSGITLSLNITDADEHLNKDALSLLRTMSLISGLIGAADLLPLDGVAAAFRKGQEAVYSVGYVENVSDLRKEAEYFCDQINGQQNLSRFEDLGQERLEVALFQNEKLLEASQLAEDATLTTKLRYARQRILTVINDLASVSDYPVLLKSRFPVLAKSEHEALLDGLVELLQKEEDLRGIVELGTSLNNAIKALTGEKQILLFRYLLDQNPLNEVLLRLPHLLRFEPWSWPTGPPGLLEKLSLLRQKDPVIFDNLLKEGGTMLGGLDLSTDAVANVSKIQQFCEDLVQNNDLVAFFEQSVGRV
ncbi:MAG: hypothetical protein KDC53_13390, partial [Saprospiraceae bacterium]|nr:hypothetical protein [Saprospiraceae bacterium]